MKVTRYVYKLTWAEAGTLARIFYIVLVGGPAVLAAISGLLPNQGLIGVPWWLWALAALNLALCSMLLSIVKRAITLEELTRPKIKLTEIIERDSAYQLHGVKRSYKLRIINDSTVDLPDCLAVIHSLTVQDESRPFTDHLPLALVSVQNAQRGERGPFNLRAGQDKIIAFCWRADSLPSNFDSPSEIVFQYEGEPHPHWSYSLRDTRDLRVVLKIYGASSPTEEVLRLTVEEGKLRVCRENGPVKA